MAKHCYNNNHSKGPAAGGGVALLCTSISNAPAHPSPPGCCLRFRDSSCLRGQSTSSQAAAQDEEKGAGRLGEQKTRGRGKGRLGASTSVTLALGAAEAKPALIAAIVINYSYST